MRHLSTTSVPSYVHKEVHKTALETSNRLIHLKPDFAAAYGYLGITYVKLRIDKAAMH